MRYPIEGIGTGVTGRLMAIGSPTSGNAGFECDLQGVENSFLVRRIKALGDFPAYRRARGYIAQPNPVPNSGWAIGVSTDCNSPEIFVRPRSKLRKRFTSSNIGRASSSKKYIFH
ncbi:hypothetical protein [Burkholderia ambifaria]|uniref:hypothetical protein n=1 Tax=Burkholderia ambifaria TaxID=152480 RepID=UPI0012FDF718|nr:hypothetical protein [Burkholderia ambifaria]